MSDPYETYQGPPAWPPAEMMGHPMGYGQPRAASAPGMVRAAAIVMGCIGLLILAGVVLVVVAIMVTPIEELARAGTLDGVPPDMDPRTLMNIGAGCVGTCGGTMGLLFLVLSPFVWKGMRGAMITGIVAAGLALLPVAFMMIAAAMQGGAGAVVAAMFWLAPMAALGVLIVLLFRGMSALRQREEQAWSQARQWQSYYQQSAAGPYPQPPGPQQPGDTHDPWGR